MLAFLAALAVAPCAAGPAQNDLFQSGTEGYHTFRIPALLASLCQASLIRLGGNRLLFSNPASTKRERMTVRLSDDGGKTWSVVRCLHMGPAAYSCLAQAGGELLCLYERGTKSPYETITLARFGPGWLKEP